MSAPVLLPTSRLASWLAAMQRVVVPDGEGYRADLQIVVGFRVEAGGLKARHDTARNCASNLR